MAAFTRVVPPTRDPVSAPNSYNIAIFGGTFADQASLGTQKILAESRLYTTRSYRIFRSAASGTPKYANGGYRLDQIRTVFETNFPLLPYYINTIDLEGGISDVTADRALSLMTADLAAMADAVIANGKYNLRIYIPSPFSSAHASRNASRIQKLRDYRDYVLNNYRQYAVDLYAGLGSASDIDTLDPLYFKVTTDLTPSDNGFRKADELAGALLFTRAPYSLTPHALNLAPKPRDLTAWSSKIACSIGGNSVKLADGTYSTEKGVIHNGSASNGQLIDSWAAGVVPNATAIEITALFRPGLYTWVRFAYTDNQGTARGGYFDFLGLALGTAIGTGHTMKIEKAENGWAKFTMTMTTGTGSAANSFDFRPASADTVPISSPAAPGSTQPSFYCDLIQIRAV